MSFRTITSHHDGHGLAESLTIEADEPGPGGASHAYLVSRGYPAGIVVADIQYQKGPRHEAGSTTGIIDPVLLAIVADRLEAFQAGPFACEENAEALDAVHAAMAAFRRRADERAKRAVLGTSKP